jgi:ATP adenylyltransferase
MDVMWSPWRSKYIQTFKDEDIKEKEDICIFCRAAENPERDDELLVVYRNKRCFVIQNKYPYNNGHIMIAPYSHAGDLNDLADDVILEMMQTVRDAKNILQKIYQPHGFNIGINLGRVAGAGVPGHIHIHIVPRWNGDTSFMPVLADIKVVSVSLEESQRMLSEEFRKLQK